MTGYLYRLAERAMGTAQPLRKASPPLFSQVLADEVFRTVTEPVQPGRNRTQAVSVKSAHRREAANTGGEAVLDPAVAPHRKAVHEKLGQTSISQPAGTRSPILVPSSGQSPATEATTRSGWLGEAHLEMDAEPPDPRRPSPTPPADIEPLLPLAQPMRLPFQVTASARTASLGSLSAGMVEETTEVHVSIGRIEVTAVHEPASLPRKTTCRNPPMSLDEYLDRRHGGRS